MFVEVQPLAQPQIPEGVSKKDYHKILDKWESITKLSRDKLEILGAEDGTIQLKVNLSRMEKGALNDKKLLAIDRFIQKLNAEKNYVEIKELDLSHNAISGRLLFGSPDGLPKEKGDALIEKKIRPFLKVEKLDMSHTNSSPNTLAYLSNFNSLKSIYFNHCPNFKELPKDLSLPRTLELISVVQETPLKKIPNLKSKFPNLKIQRAETLHELDIRALKKPLAIEICDNGFDLSFKELQKLAKKNGVEPPTSYEQFFDKKYVDMMEKEGWSVDFLASHLPRVKKTYEVIKERFSSLPGVNIKFNDDTYSFTIYHSDKEVNSLIGRCGLNNNFARITMLQEIGGTMAGGSEFGSVFDKTRESVEKKEKREKALLSSCGEFYRNHVSEHVPIESNTNNGNQLLFDALKRNEGVCIGEAHTQKAPKKILMQNMEALAKQGVKTLYLEHLAYDSIQPLLDAYNESPTAELPLLLDINLSRLDSGFSLDSNYNYTNLVKAAKRAGIAVVAIDTTLSYLTGTTDKMGVTEESAYERYAGMNAVSTTIIQEEQKKRGGKYVALMGNAHISTIEDVPGVSNLLQVPSIFVEDTNEAKGRVRYEAFHPISNQKYSATISIRK